MNNNRESLLRRVQMYAFAAHECALYLNCHPNNRKALEKHAAAVKSLDEAVKQYEGMYGPLTAKSAGGQSWNWVKGRWPWQNYEPDGKEN